MSEHEDETQIFDTGDSPVPEDDGHPAGQKSILDLLKADYKDVAETKEVYIPVAGWERTGLSVRYRLPTSGVELDAIARKVNQQYNRNDRYNRGFFTAVDTMIMLCDGLYIKHPDDPSQWVELDPNENGAPLDFGDGEELSSIFGWNGNVSSARDVVKRMFGNNEMSILDHCGKLQRWMVDTKTDITTELWQLSTE